MSKIDVRIFGVPERMEWISKNKGLLGVPDDKIVVDFDHEGCVPTAKRTWLLPTDKPFVMVLADDVELCEGLMPICERIVSAHPNSIISLFPLQFIRSVPGSRLPQKSPYVLTKYLSGCGIIMRSEWVKPCIESWPENAHGDDASIQAWADKNRIPVLTTLPALIQHIGDTSVFDPSRSLGRTPYFSKTPLCVDFDSTYVTPWTNIIEE